MTQGKSEFCTKHSGPEFTQSHYLKAYVNEALHELGATRDVENITKIYFHVH